MEQFTDVFLFIGFSVWACGMLALGYDLDMFAFE